eukprot:gb/GECH01014348.1/.p1 GENE.gb/GECH01014348.1/~~gb/GECH01014348.1/.p1  ORF type:complete len:158 (+),score=34.26 gb/GECH01014348.1/:1-474(+)
MLRSISFKKPVVCSTSRLNNSLLRQNKRSFTSFNRVTLIGKLAFDPREYIHENGNKASFIVLTAFQGPEKILYNKHYVNVTPSAFEKATELKKGDLVFVEGVLNHRRFVDSLGKTRYSSAVLVKQSNNIKLLGVAEAQNIARNSQDDIEELYDEEEQ